MRKLPKPCRALAHDAEVQLVWYLLLPCNVHKGSCWEKRGIPSAGGREVRSKL